MRYALQAALDLVMMPSFCMLYMGRQNVLMAKVLRQIPNEGEHSSREQNNEFVVVWYRSRNGSTYYQRIQNSQLEELSSTEQSIEF